MGWRWFASLERWYAYWARFITTRVFPPTSLSVPESADTRLCNRPDYAQKPAWVSMVKPCEAWKRDGRRRTARKHFVGVTQFRPFPGMGGVQKSRGNGSNRLYLARQFESQIIDLWVSSTPHPQGRNNNRGDSSCLSQMRFWRQLDSAHEIKATLCRLNRASSIVVSALS